MKTGRLRAVGKGIFGTGLMLLSLLVPPTFAATQTPAPYVAPDKNTPSAAPIQVSPGIADVLKLVQAKVELRVIKAYIKNSRIAYDPSAQEIILLKKLGVPEDLLVALVSRGAELKAKSLQTVRERERQARQNASTPPPAYAPPPQYGGIVPQYPPYANAYPGYGYNSYPAQGALPYGSITSVNSSVPLYSVNGQPVYSGFYLNPDPTAYGLFGTFNNSYPTYVDGVPVYSAFFVPGYGYLW